MGKRWLFSDLDHTLYDYHSCNDAATRATIDELDRRYGGDAAGWYDLGREETKLLLKGTAASHSRLLYIARAIEGLTGRTDPAAALEIERLFWETNDAKLVPYQNAVARIEALREEGWGFGVITNFTAREQYRKLERLGLSGLLDAVITSEEAGVEKPHPRIYALALSRTGCTASDVLYVDDDKVAVQGARAAGWRAILLDDPADWDTLG